jgi:hypothetical protein
MIITAIYVTIYKHSADFIQIFCITSPIIHSQLTVISLPTIGVQDGGAGGAAAPPKRLESRKVGQMFNISRVKSGKLKSEKAKKSPVCWANKGSRAIFASQSGNIGLL